MRIWLGSENKRAGPAGILWIPPQHCFIASCCCCRCAGSLRMMWRSATLAAHISPAGKRRPTVATVAGYSARIVCQSRCQYRTFIQGRIFCPHCLSKQVPYFHPNRIICLDCLSKQVPYFHPGPNILPGLSIKSGTRTVPYRHPGPDLGLGGGGGWAIGMHKWGGGGGKKR